MAYATRYVAANRTLDARAPLLSLVCVAVGEATGLATGLGLALGEGIGVPSAGGDGEGLGVT